MRSWTLAGTGKGSGRGLVSEWRPRGCGSIVISSWARRGRLISNPFRLFHCTGAATLIYAAECGLARRPVSPHVGSAIDESSTV
jgi:hypothetical protein